jgi:energy-coupling factor transporter ATP-binding protein EcfA2
VVDGPLSPWLASGVVDLGGPVAELTGVSFRYPATPDWAIHQVDWTVERGSFTVIAGASGSGKSTLLRTLNGLVPHYSGGRFGGRVLVAGRDTRRNGPRDLASSVGFVFQDPEAQLVMTRVEDEIAFGPEQFGMSRQAMRVRVEESLDLVGIAHLRDREIATLSGGERQRLAIAASLALRPAMLVLDEPTSQLDPWSAEEVIGGLVRLNHDLGLTVVLAEHRLERVTSEADELRFSLTDGGWLAGSPRGVLADTRVPPAFLPPVARLGRALGWSPLPVTVREGRRAVALDGRRPLPPSEPIGTVAGRPVVETADLRLGHAIPGGTAEVLRRVDLSIRPGEILALMGRNASGKTTLLRAIAGLIEPLSGSIVIGGAIRRHGDFGDGRIGYLPQDPGSLLFSETVADDLRMSQRAAGQRTMRSLPDIPNLLVRLGLDGVAERHPRSLSGGQRQRVAIGAVLAGGPEVVLLDEPTRGMDGDRKAGLSDLLRGLASQGIAIVMATHDVELAATVASRVVMLGGGEVVADGDPRAILGTALSYGPQMSKLYGPAFLTVEDVTRGLEVR